MSAARPILREPVVNAFELAREYERQQAGDAKLRLREGWLRKIEAHTKEHRFARAARFRRRGRVVRLMAAASGLSDWTARDRGRWFDARARGQEERIDRVLECGTGRIVIAACQACGELREASVACGCRALCVSCRGVLSWKIRAKFIRAREVLLRQATQDGLTNPRKFDRYTEKFMTLTAPHVGDWRDRLNAIVLAVPRFIRELRKKWRASGHLERCAYVRVYEWTPGEDGLGHPHVHLWLFSPYVQQDEIAALWTVALKRSGFSIATGVRAVVHVQQARGQSVAKELIKYLLKDLASGGGYVEPAEYAKVYVAFDGMRAVQASRGFFKLAGKHVARCACGAEGCFEIRIRKRSTESASDASWT
jgi:hypothetical protein